MDAREIIHIFHFLWFLFGGLFFIVITLIFDTIPSSLLSFFDR